MSVFFCLKSYKLKIFYHLTTETHSSQCNFVNLFSEIIKTVNKLFFYFPKKFVTLQKN